MKYKVVAFILDGVVCSSEYGITCFMINSLVDANGNVINPRKGDILDESVTKRAGTYWEYSRKEWEDIVKNLK